MEPNSPTNGFLIFWFILSDNFGGGIKMQGHYLATVTNQNIYDIAKELCEEEIKKIEQVCY